MSAQAVERAFADVGIEFGFSDDVILQIIAFQAIFLGLFIPAQKFGPFFVEVFLGQVEFLALFLHAPESERFEDRRPVEVASVIETPPARDENIDAKRSDIDGEFLEQGFPILKPPQYPSECR